MLRKTKHCVLCSDENLREARSVKKTVRCTVFSEYNEASAEVRQIAEQYASCHPDQNRIVILIQNCGSVFFLKSL